MDESSFVRLRQLGQIAVAFAQELVFPCLKIKHLLVSDRLAQPEKQKHRGCDCVVDVPWNVVVLRNDNGGRDEGEDCKHLKEADEDDVEELESPTRIPSSNDGPTMVLTVTESTLDVEIVCQSGPPESHSDTHEEQSMIERGVVAEEEIPDIDDRRKTPQTIDNGGISCAIFSLMESVHN